MAVLSEVTSAAGAEKIPQTMRAAVYRGVDDVRVEAVPASVARTQPSSMCPASAFRLILPRQDRMYVPMVGSVSTCAKPVASSDS